MSSENGRETPTLVALRPSDILRRRLETYRGKMARQSSKPPSDVTNQALLEVLLTVALDAEGVPADPQET